MGQVSASEIALQIPDLLASVLRYLGPLEWVKCASVCPDWCDAILSRDETTEAGGAAAAASMMAPTPAATRAAPSTIAAEGGGGGGATMVRRAEGERKETAKAAKAAAAVTANLWCEFASTLMANNNEDTIGEGKCSDRTSADEGGCSLNNSEGGAFSSCRLNPHAAGITTRGGRVPSANRVRGCFYRSVCLEGDPAVLGPPLIARTARVGNNSGRGEVEVAMVSLRDVTAASVARYRQRR